MQSLLLLVSPTAACVNMECLSEKCNRQKDQRQKFMTDTTSSTSLWKQTWLFVPKTDGETFLKKGLTWLHKCFTWKLAKCARSEFITSCKPMATTRTYVLFTMRYVLLHQCDIPLQVSTQTACWDYNRQLCFWTKMVAFLINMTIYSSYTLKQK